MKKRYIQLPKGYLSYSQKQLWKSSKAKYIEQYFEGRKNSIIYNDSMVFGSEFAYQIEHAQDSGDLLTDATALMLKKYDQRDQEIIAEIKTKSGWIKIIGRPDTFNSKTCDFREYKTGLRPWTQRKAEKHSQLTFYGMLIYLKHNVAPDHCWLDWIETEKVKIVNDFLGEIEQMKPTGKILSFKVEIGLRRILEEIADTIKVAEEIELAYASYIPQINKLTYGLPRHTKLCK